MGGIKLAESQQRIAFAVGESEVGIGIEHSNAHLIVSRQSLAEASIEEVEVADGSPSLRHEVRCGIVGYELPEFGYALVATLLIMAACDMETRFGEQRSVGR